MLVSVPSPSSRVPGNAANVAASFVALKIAEYHVPATRNWFTSVGLNVCVQLICDCHSGWSLVSLNTGLIGSVTVGCTPWSY